MACPIFAVVGVSQHIGEQGIITASASGTQDMTSVQTNGTEVVFNVNNGATASNVTTSSGAVTTGTFQVLDAISGMVRHRKALTSMLAVLLQVPCRTSTIHIQIHKLHWWRQLIINLRLLRR